jgi:hypothetical protein
MNATIISRTPTSFTLQVEVPYNNSMLDFGWCLALAADLCDPGSGGGDPPKLLTS